MLYISWLNGLISHVVPFARVSRANLHRRAVYVI